MAVDITQFKPAHPYLICVDSDGCAMDSMTIKHVECFGPCMVKAYGLEEKRGAVLEIWNKLNLYSMTRGINRFLGLVTTLDILSEKGMWQGDYAALKQWATNSDELSENSLKQQLQSEDTPDLRLALSWSQDTNRNIKALPREKNKPFEGTREALIKAAKVADVVVVSSANRQAVMEEWEYFGLLDKVSIVMTQEQGSKASCIARMLDFGYTPDKVLMVGDAPGDFAAAEKNGVRCYPILAGHEIHSWHQFTDTILDTFIAGHYDIETMLHWQQKFEANLS